MQNSKLTRLKVGFSFSRLGIMNKFILLSLRSVGSKLATLTPNDNFDFACYTNKNLMVNVYCVCVFSVFLMKLRNLGRLGKTGKF